MKTIGLLGGMSWESTAVYYRAINTEVKKRLGGFHSAKSVVVSIDFAELEKLQSAGDWDAQGDLLIDVARQAEQGGAEILLIATNTMHEVFDRVRRAVSIPMIHIADPTGEALLERGVKKVGLLGTAFTMERAFYRERLENRFGLEVLTPDAVDRKTVHDVIYHELVQGIITEESRQAYRGAMQRLIDRGAEAIILGCTEIGLLVGESDAAVPLVDTALEHAKAAVDAALEGRRDA